MNHEDLIRYVMEDEEVKESKVTSYQLAMVVGATLDFINNQPERSKREDDEDLIMKHIAPLCDTIIELR